MTTPTTPTTVEPGQMWRDNDQRTKGSGEFVVLAVVQGSGASHGGPSTPTTRLERAMIRAEQKARRDGREYVVIERDGATYLTRIRTDRLLKGANTQRGYTYLGMSR